MDLIIYPTLSTCSKRAIRKTKKRWGHKNEYTPRRDLILRLMDQFNWSDEQVREQIQKEREFIIKYPQYY